VKSIVLLLILIGVVCGCAHHKRPPTEYPKSGGNEMAAGVAGVIDARADLAHAKVAIGPEKDAYISGADGDLEAAQPHFTAAGKQFNSTAEELAKLKATVNKSRDAQLNWLITAGIVLVGISMVIFFSGSKFASSLGLGGAVCGISVICLSMFVQAVQPWIPWAVGTLAFAFVGYAIWRMIIQQRATKDLVGTVSLIRSELPSPKDKQLFGENGAVNQIQASTTEHLVKRAKKEIAEDCVPALAEAAGTEPTPQAGKPKKRTA
jgi:hypothetical protein